MNISGTRMVGSNSILTSVADAEILPNTAQRLTDFELMNDQACTISINGGAFIHLRALQGIAFDFVQSARIHENGITFNWIGTVA